jgi:hypothetical protein
MSQLSYEIDMENASTDLLHLLDLIEKGKFPQERYADIVKYLQCNNDYLIELHGRVKTNPRHMSYEEAFDLAHGLSADKDYVADMCAFFLSRHEQAMLDGLPNKLSSDGKLTEAERETYQKAFCAPYSYLSKYFSERIKVIERLCVTAKIHLDRENYLLQKFRDM